MTLPFSRVSAVTVDSEGNIQPAGAFPLVGIPSVITFTGANYTVSAPQVIPLQAVPSQQFNITLNNQDCAIKIYSKSIYIPDSGTIPTDPPLYDQITPMFMDLFLNSSLVLGGILCRNQVLLLHNTYFGFSGDFAFIDTQGSDDPNNYTQLGSRWQLVYYTPLPPYPGFS